MIIVRYRGGLGNQMFQYAFQTALSKRYPDEIIKADISHYRLLREHNGFELDKAFGCVLDIASREEVINITNLYVPSERVLRLPEILQDRIAKKYQYKITEFNRRFHKDKESNYYRCKFHNSFEDVVLHLNMEHDWYLDGLWQNLDYFSGYMEDIRQAFAFDNKNRFSEEDRKSLDEIRNGHSVSVHVRRGDFVNSKFDICNRDYYQRAMKWMETHLENIAYFFFTDDISFVENEFANIKNKKIISHSVENSIVDMEMMSNCKGHIISNSTFSYWAALLDGKEDKKVAGPAYSIKNKIGGYELSAPADWHLLEV